MYSVGGGLQPYTSGSKKPKFRSVSFKAKKQSANESNTTDVSAEHPEEVKPVHVSQDSGIECFHEPLHDDDVTELPQSSPRIKDPAPSQHASDVTENVEKPHKPGEKVKIPVIESEIVGTESFEPLHDEKPVDENLFYAPERKVAILVPLSSNKDDNQECLSHSDIDERPYTDDDIDDFTDDDFNECQNSNNNNLNRMEINQFENKQLISAKKDFTAQLLHSDAAVLVHDTNGELTGNRCVENLKGSQPSNDDFVQPPLPPPPSEDFLGSQTSVHNNVGNGVKSYKSVKPAIWSPTPKTHEDLPLPPPPSANELSAASPPPVQSAGKPKGFRSVSLQVSKDQEHCDNSISMTEVPYPGSDRLSPLSSRNGRSSPFKDGLQSDRPLSSMSNSSQSSGYVTLLRDTRQILIKPVDTAAPAKVETSNTFSFQGAPFPTSPKADAAVTPASQLPEGAVYQTTTQEGNLVHTDTYYPANGNGADNKSVVLERTKKTTVVRAPHHTGIGPVNETGVPCALRTTVDDSKHWYKNMFKQMHKIEKDDVDDGRPSSANDVTPVNDRTAQHHASMEIEKPKKVGRITDYHPAEPYVVENKPIQLNLNAPEAPRRRRVVHRPNTNQSNGSRIQRSSSLEDFSNMQWGDFFDDILKPKSPGTIWDMEAIEQTKNTVPVASTSYKPPATRKTAAVPDTAASASSYTAYRNAMSGQTKSPHPHTATKHGKSDEANKLRQPARAKFDFSAQTSKELSAKKGQTLIVTRRVDDNWYMAETVDGMKSGIIPVQYIEIISTTVSPPKPVRNGLGKAKFDFTGKTKVELSFKQGDEIALLKKVDANWYKGKIGGITGILPAVYVEVVVEPESAEATKTKPKVPKELEVSPKTTTSPRTTSSLSSQHSHSLSQASSNSDPDENERKQRAAFLAHSVVDATVQLQPKDSHKHRGEFDLSELDRVVDALNEPQATTGTDGNFPAPPPAQTLLAPSVPSYPSSNISSQPSSPRLQTPPPHAPEIDFGQVIGRYVALYAYEASNDDELDLVAGDVIVVVETCDDGWFVGTCQRTGAFGTFPGNYVTPANS
uniref:Sorbin and SH3 domain-containing protein 1-like n=1 Tax=Phallusia mammillata TaxID=59560 RepID=A0A6F9DSP3_9ASCI|nr:sorbin and SH3 domain-containing protein 1-like [Phallusia mammillata]